jgi:diadenosine tetraphosphate (Ap4A) HIT family hydrolase
MDTADDAAILEKFRSVCNEIEELQLKDYHFKVSNGFDHEKRMRLPGWDICVSYRVYKDGREPQRGPLQVSRCMSCDLDCPLELGVQGEEHASADGPTAKDSLIYQGEHTRAWLDAKGRPMLIVTPLPHRERLFDLADAELVALWRTAAAQLDRLGLRHFNAMAINHGRNRNHEHLHLKVKLRAWDFDRAVDRAAGPDGPDLRRRLAAIRDFARRRLGRRPEDHFFAPRPGGGPGGGRGGGGPHKRGRC